MHPAGECSFRSQYLELLGLSFILSTTEGLHLHCELAWSVCCEHADVGASFITISSRQVPRDHLNISTVETEGNPSNSANESKLLPLTLYLNGFAADRPLPEFHKGISERH